MLSLCACRLSRPSPVLPRRTSISLAPPQVKDTEGNSRIYSHLEHHSACQRLCHRSGKFSHQEAPTCECKLHRSLPWTWTMPLYGFCLISSHEPSQLQGSLASGITAVQVLSVVGDEIRQWGRGASARWLGYLSSTSVYGDWGGAWVNERYRPVLSPSAHLSSWQPMRRQYPAHIDAAVTLQAAIAMLG